MEDFFEGARYGKEIYEPNDEDVPRKKQKLSRREEREKERQLFHGAFKGGFSVGHFGTVGSKEGFQPKTFKSSRKDQNHSERIRQTVEDFIDSEDEEAFGSSSCRIRMKKSYEKEKEVKRVPHTERQLLAFSVEKLLAPQSNTVGERLLQSLGWKPGQGIGKKISLQRKNPLLSSVASNQTTISPEDIQAIITKFKEDTFGLGYQGLEKPSFSSVAPSSQNHVFGTLEKGKKIRISGQAFGVGMDEDNEDMDVYSKEDLSQYDFELAPAKPDIRKKEMFSTKLEDRFVLASKPWLFQKYYKPPDVPKDFKPHLEEVEVKQDTISSEGLVGRKERFNLLKKGNVGLEWEGKEVDAKERPKEEDFLQKLFLSRFVSKGTDQTATGIEKETELPTSLSKARRGGRITVDWFPDKLLCTRFNVPCPYLSVPEKKTERKTSLPLFTALALAKEKKQQQASGVESFPAPQEAPPEREPERELPKTEEADLVTAQFHERPPIDLFKAIFADSESEDEVSTLTQPSITETAELGSWTVESKVGGPYENMTLVPAIEQKKDVGKGQDKAYSEEMKKETIDENLPAITEKPIFTKTFSKQMHKVEEEDHALIEKGKMKDKKELAETSKSKVKSDELRRLEILERLKEFDDLEEVNDLRKVVTSESEDEWVEIDRSDKKKKKQKKRKKEKKKKY